MGIHVEGFRLRDSLAWHPIEVLYPSEGIAARVHDVLSFGFLQGCGQPDPGPLPKRGDDYEFRSFTCGQIGLGEARGITCKELGSTPSSVAPSFADSMACSVVSTLVTVRAPSPPLAQ